MIPGAAAVGVGGSACAEGSSPRTLVFTTLYPNPVQPRLGIFVRNRVVAVAERCPTQVVAPVLSRLPGRRFEHGFVRAIPLREEPDGLPVHHPRFTTLAGLGRCADGALLFGQTVAYVARLREDFPFDLIDAHYAFPDGAAAVRLGRRFKVPVCVTVRGGDLDLLTRFRFRRDAIRRTLQQADRVFAVSSHLAERAVHFGADPARVSVVENGVEPRTFVFTDQTQAREELGLSLDGPMLLCVANLIPEKGQHVLLEALTKLDGRASRPPNLVFIGGNPQSRQGYCERLIRRAAELKISDRVHFLGSKPQRELRPWYGAADLLVLPTFREGCPNVVREALACGTPVVASRVGGVPELVTGPELGMLVEAGDPGRLAEALQAALGRRWDRRAIAASGGGRSWQDVACVIHGEFVRVVGAGARAA